MRELVGREVGAEAVVDHAQDIAVEARGEPVGVVVGRFDLVDVLNQVEAEQEVVLGRQLGRHPGEKGGRFGPVQVADRRAQEENQPRPDRRRRSTRSGSSRSATGPWWGQRRSSPSFWSRRSS